MAERLLAEPKQRKLWLRRLAAHLLRTNRVADVDLLVNDIAAELQAQAGHLSVEVTSARKLTPAARNAISKQLLGLTGASAVDLYETVDADLVGGFVARTPEAELDASLQHGLRKLAAIA
jgi:F0F1-type ATP synthase delta subunit